MLVALVHVDLTGQPGATAQGAAPALQKEELSQTYRGSRRNDVEYQKVAPFKVFDNLYYVGPGYVSVWLLQTADGLILLDSAQEPYVDHVIDGIRKLGFDPKNIRYILIGHGHLDHFGDAARIQEVSGARVGMIAEDWETMEQAARPCCHTRSPCSSNTRDAALANLPTLCRWLFGRDAVPTPNEAAWQ